MSHYLFLHGDKAAVLDVPKDTTSDQWGVLRDEFAKACRARGEGFAVGCVHLWRDQYRDGVFWDEWLGSSQGMSFRFYPFAGVTPAKLQAVRSSIRRDRDVVHMSTHQIRVWLPAGTLALQVKPEDVIL